MIFKLHRVLLILLTLTRFAIFVLPFERSQVFRKIRIALQELGGAWAKIGQALALRFDLLAPGLCYELFELLNQMKPFAFTEVRAIIRSELHEDPETLFTTFEQEPFAAASIGQVHRATLPTGERVAVKVRRPDIRQALAIDFGFLNVVAALIDLFSLLGSMSARSFVHQFERSLYEELDFRNEARHARMLADKGRGNRLEEHAKVFVNYSTERVLTTCLFEGVSLLDLLEQSKSTSPDKSFQEYNIDEICRNLLRNTLRQVFDKGYFHADLHPANIFVLPGNVIGYVDFGIVGSFPSSLRTSLTYYAMQLFRGDLEQSTREFMRWITPSPATDIEAAHNDILSIAENYYCSVTFDTPGAAQNTFASYQISVLNAVRRHNMTISPSIVSSFRTLISVITMIYHLKPTFPLARQANNFFSELLFEDAVDCLSVSELMRQLFEVRVRLNSTMNALESISRTGTVTDSLPLTHARNVMKYVTLALLSVGSVYFASVHSWCVSGSTISISLVWPLLGASLLFFALTLREAGRVISRKAPGKPRSGR
jgi:ubiquinone biosynthesis protein